MSSCNLHIYFFPLMAPGHMIPLVDMARQFAKHGSNTKVTLILSHLNAPQFHTTIKRERQRGFDINIREIRFPSAQVGLPDGCECLSSIASPHMSVQFIKALELLKQPVELILKQDRPDCLVSDFLFSWTNEIAAELKIPRLIFHGAGFFPLCVYHSLIKHKPYMGLESDHETFIVPGLPDVIKMTKRQLPDYLRGGDEPGKYPVGNLVKDSTEKESTSFGVVVNSFKELEPAYVDYYKRIIGKKVWHVGPVSLCNTDNTDKAHRGNETMTVRMDCLDWLGTKESDSVVYVCFGTVSFFSDAQLQEIAIGLESCGRDFIWVVKNDENKEWLPEGFEERVGEKGLMIKSWAPQVLILEHESVGGFLTHCGWNSLIEGVSAGKPMITWPISSEQFDNEKLVTEVLKIGVGVGSVEWTKRTDVKRGLIKAGNIAEVVNHVMGGEESVRMKNKVRALSDEAKKAVEKGGSSYSDLDLLLEELRLNKCCKI